MEKLETYHIESKESCAILLKLINHWLYEISKENEDYSKLTLEEIISKIIKLQEKIGYEIYTFYETSKGNNSSDLIRDLKILINQKNLKSHQSELCVTINPSGVLNASRIILPKIIEIGLKE